MKAVLVGYGEVGKSLYEVFSEAHEIKITDPLLGKDADGTYEVMLVAIPYTNEFFEEIIGYKRAYKPNCTIVFSSVAVGTCRQLGAVHSPVEGVHPNLANSIRNSPRWIGGNDPIAERFFREAGWLWKDLITVDQPEWTEFLKLRSTSLYGLNIEFARYTKEVADRLKMPYYLATDYDKWYNQLYQDQEMERYRRYLLNPPKGDIGGHCVVPNARILDKQFPNLFLKEIYRKKEG